MKEQLEKLKDLKGIFLTTGAIIAGVLGGYWWLQDSIVARNSKIITTAVIESIKDDINPMDRTSYLEFRRRDSIERLNAELLAIEFMTRQDSMRMVEASKDKMLGSMEKRLAYIEMKLRADTIDKVDDKLAMIMTFLQEQASIDSVRFKMELDMEARRLKNAGLIDNIKSGDRLK